MPSGGIDVMTDIDPAPSAALTAAPSARAGAR